MFAGLPRFLEQLLAACFRKEAWEVSRLSASEEERPQKGMKTYDCAPESAEAGMVFAAENLDLLIYRLERDPALGARRLDAMLRFACASKVRRVFLLSGDEVFAPHTMPTEQDELLPQGETGALLARLEAQGLSWRAQGLSVSIVRLAELYAPGQTSDDGFIGRLFGAALMNRPLPRYTEPAAVSCGFLDARDAVYAIYQAAARGFDGAHPVSYTHLTLPTKLEV